MEQPGGLTLLELFKTAARENDPRLRGWWDTILDIQNHMINTDTGAIRPFGFFQWRYPFQYPDFVRMAYSQLRSHNEWGTIRAAIEALGHTKPGLLDQLRSPVTGLAEHELSTDRRRKRSNRPDQTFVATIHSDAEHWATAGALRSINNNSAVDPATTRDLPRTFAAKKNCVHTIVNVLTDMAHKLGGDNKETRLINFTSPKVLESLGWDMVDYLISAQMGEPNVYPWATAFFHEDYPTFEARFNEFLALVMTSKAAAANMFWCSYMERFANNPAGEIRRKTGNKEGNTKKDNMVARLRARVAAIDAQVVPQLNQAPVEAGAQGQSATSSGRAYGHAQMSFDGPVTFGASSPADLLARPRTPASRSRQRQNDAPFSQYAGPRTGPYALPVPGNRSHSGYSTSGGTSTARQSAAPIQPRVTPPIFPGTTTARQSTALVEHSITLPVAYANGNTGQGHVDSGEYTGDEALDNQYAFDWNGFLPEGSLLERDVTAPMGNAANEFNGLGCYQGMNPESYEAAEGYGDANGMFNANVANTQAQTEEPAANTSSRIVTIERGVDDLGNVDTNEPACGPQAFGEPEPFGSNQGYAGNGKSFDDTTVSPSYCGSAINKSQNGDYVQGSAANFVYLDDEEDLFADSFLASQTADRTVGAGEKRKRGTEEEDEDELPRARRSRQV
ncbi:uncharacterized protein B0T23DRAFT_327795 [Neurospora hispaniola]|uniref:Uncharacterized protein n=1 Tax=Neurospora hispaniola TaxID=588809 RepID=A0AAJ0MLL2_9PEZI|nr:hypothetical protein B0T23DRAFT_327795 [Neurospora hispaniola]